MHTTPLASVTYETATDQRSPAARKYHIWTIGCQMNVADSNHVAAELEKIGYGPTDRLDDADVVVLNTCVVRQSAEDKVIGKLGNLKPWKKARRPQGSAHGLHGRRKPGPCSSPPPILLSTSLCRPASRPRWSTTCARPKLTPKWRRSSASSTGASPPSAGRGAAGRHRPVDQASRPQWRSTGGRPRAHRLWLQPRLHLLHHPLPPRRGTLARSRRSSTRCGLAWWNRRARGDAAGPDRRPLWL